MPTPLVSSSAPQEPTQRMTLSQRLTRAGLTFLLFGTVAAMLPASDVTAASAGPCVTASSLMVLSYDPPGTSSPAPATPPLYLPPNGTGIPSDLRVFISPSGSPTAYQNASDTNFPGRKLQFQLIDFSGSTEDFIEEYPYPMPSSSMFATAVPSGPLVSYSVVTPPEPASIDATDLFASQKATTTPPSHGMFTASFTLGSVTLMDSRPVND